VLGAKESRDVRGLGLFRVAAAGQQVELKGGGRAG
jgi:hypothetical protein